MADKIHAYEVHNYGKRSLYMTTRDGTVTTGIRKDGSEVKERYDAGDFVLSDSKTGVVVGPVNITAARGMAFNIIKGEARAITEPQALLVLAVALIGIGETATLDPAKPVALPFPEDEVSTGYEAWMKSCPDGKAL